MSNMKTLVKIIAGTFVSICMITNVFAQAPSIGALAALATKQLQRLNQAGTTTPFENYLQISQQNNSRYHTPKKGSSERKGIMNAARIPMSREIGQKVIFVVSIVRSDGQWAYLQAVPHHPSGSKLDWMQTPFAQDWKGDMMSDIVMVLLQKSSGGWQAVDYVIGPTDVHWYSWLDQYGLPEALFSEQ